MRTRQRGNTVIGLIVGIVLGLGLALGVAVYVTKVPIPFVTKTQPRGADQDEAEARKNRDWDPNSPLAGKLQAPRTPPQPIAPAPAAPPAVAGAPATVGPLNGPSPAPVVVAPKPSAPSASSDPLGDFARSRAGGQAASAHAPGTAVASVSPSASPDPFVYFVQAGAFRTTDDAEAQRAKLSLMGVEAKVTEREQAGRTVYRVRAGPFNKKDDADRLKDRLDGGGFDAALVRVQR